MDGEGVLIITRLYTQNAGNEALSKELIHFAKTSVPGTTVRALDRYPRYFEQFTLDGLGRDPVAAFERQVDKLIAAFGTIDAPLADVATEERVKLDARGKELTGPLRALKRKIGFRRRLAAMGLIERQAPATAIQSCMKAKLVIWNPAGEIRPTPTSADHVVRLLLLLGVAQRMGRHTAVINHSLEVGDERLRKLITHVYSNASYVGLRDAKSIATAREFGVPAEKLVESPDLVFLASKRPGAPATTAVPQGAIGISINGLEALVGTNEWQKLITELARLERPLLFVSNAMNHDLEWARTMAGWAPERSTVIDYQPGYKELRGLYASCSVLISSRLHASVLSLAEGVPVVSIEPSVFKLTAIFQQMQYPLPTEKLQEPGWSDRVLAHVRFCLSPEGKELAARGDAIMAEQAARIERGYAPLFALAGERGRVGADNAPQQAVA